MACMQALCDFVYANFIVHLSNNCAFQFVLTATGSEADKIVSLPRTKWRGAGLGRVPIFYGADYVS